MRVQKNILLLIGVSCLLLTAACVERQVPARGVATEPAGVEEQNHAVGPDANTKDYVHGWTFPTGDSSGKGADAANSKENRERMLPNETDSYRRAWTFPAGESSTPEDSSVTPESSSGPQKVQPQPSDTEEFINSWTSE